jgi:hypothetical protein
MKNKKIIIGSLLFLLFLGLILFFLFGGKQKQTETEGIPTPTPEVPPVVEQIGKGDPDAIKQMGEAIQQGYPLFSFTPHRETNWTLDYVDALHLVVTVKGTITEAVKTEVLSWIREQGVDPATHQLDWVSSR